MAVFIQCMHATLNVGDFVMARQGESDVLCKITSVINPLKVKVQWWLGRDNPYFSQNGRSLPPTLNSSMYPNVTLCQLIECFEVVNYYSTIETVYIVDLAFIFHVDTVEHHWVNCCGMVRVFFTQFKYINDQWISVSGQHHSPFCYDYGESYPCRIWYSILNVVERINKLMSYKQQLQYLKRSDTAFFPYESWCFIYRVLAREQNRHFSNRTIAKKLIYPDLSLRKSRVTNQLVSIHISTPADMAKARQLFGRTFCVGCRNDFPSVLAPSRKLLETDVVNLVNVDGNATAMEEHCVDFVFDVDVQRLRLQVRYDCVGGNNDYVRELLNFTRPRDSEIDLNTLPEIQRDTRFIMDGVLVKVIAVTEDRQVLVERTTGNHIQSRLTFDDALRLIIESNS